MKSMIERGDIHFRQEVQKQRKKLISNRPKRQQLFSIYHLIINQRNFTYKACQSLVYILSCASCRSKRSIKAKMRSDFLLDKGIEKLEKQLDVSHLINN